MATEFAIRSGLVLNGRPEPVRPADVLVSRGVIVDSLPANTDPIELDATSCYVAPGFIDAHANATWGPFVDRDCRPLAWQGITTAISGNCGGALFPAVGEAKGWIDRILGDHGASCTWEGIKDYAAAGDRLGIDVLPLAGHATARVAVAGFAKEGLAQGQLEALRSTTRELLKDGAWGVSFGLAYPPGAYAATPELMTICSVVAEHGAVAAFHIRIESAGIEASVDEVCRLALSSKARVIICHHKALGRSNWGATTRTLERIMAARAEGAQIFLDLYPYTASSRNLAMLLPDEAHAGGRAELVHRLEDTDQRKRLAIEMERNAGAWGADWNDTIIMRAPHTPELEGRRADDLLAELGSEGLLVALAANGGRILTMYDGASWDDLSRVASLPLTMVGSDGDVQSNEHEGHPRSFRTVPTFLSEVVVKRQLLGWEEAIRRMTALPASVFGLRDRGRIETGLRADICVFDPTTVGPAAQGTGAFAEPWPRHVLVAGVPIVIDGKPTGARPGRIQLRRSDPD